VQKPKWPYPSRRVEAGFMIRSAVLQVQCNARALHGRPGLHHTERGRAKIDGKKTSLKDVKCGHPVAPSDPQSRESS